MEVKPQELKESFPKVAKHQSTGQIYLPIMLKDVVLTKKMI